MGKRLILASASPRRADLLRSAGVDFDILPADIDEEPHAEEAPRDFAMRLARNKARAIATAQRHDDRRLVLGADTIVVIDNQILGKPRDRAAATTMIRRLQGRVHDVISAFCLISKLGEHLQAATTRVQMRPLDDTEIEIYLDRSAWEDKAGAYAIQAEAGYLIREIRGSYSNVVGLPLCETIEALNDLDARLRSADS